MRYTNFFGRHFKEHGQPRLTNDYFSIYFNIICLENKIYGMEILKKKFKDSSNYHQFDVEIDTLEKRLFSITTDQAPEFFLRDLVMKSSPGNH